MAARIVAFVEKPATGGITTSATTPTTNARKEGGMILLSPPLILLISSPAGAGRQVVALGRELEQDVRPDDQVDAGGHQRRRVDERADRRRALHRVRKPRLEGELRRLGDGAAEQAERDEVHEPVVRGEALG